MKYTQLGNTGIEVSRICVGCMSYGKPSEEFHLWTLNQEETTKMIKHALDLGVNFFDTANGYSHGTSEEFLGKALKDLAPTSKSPTKRTKWWERCKPSAVDLLRC